LAENQSLKDIIGPFADLASATKAEAEYDNDLDEYIILPFRGRESS
jgi:hypothetical protein